MPLGVLLGRSCRPVDLSTFSPDGAAASVPAEPLTTSTLPPLVHMTVTTPSLLLKEVLLLLTVALGAGPEVLPLPLAVLPLPLQLELLPLPLELLPLPLLQLELLPFPL